MFSSWVSSKLKPSLLSALCKLPGMNQLSSSSAESYISTEFDAFEYGYCSLPPFLESFLKWYQTEYENLKLTASSSGIRAVEKIKVHVDRIKFKIKEDGDLSQGHLGKQLVLFFERHADIRNRAMYLSQLRDRGYCSGISFLDTVAFHNGQTEYFKRLSTAIAKWDGKDSSLDVLKTEIVEFAKLFLKPQHSDSMLSLGHAEWPRIQRRLGDKLFAKEIKHNGVVSFPELNANAAINVRDKIVLASREEKGVKARSFAISAYEHCSVVHDTGSFVRYLDPNCATGTVECNATAIPTLMLASHHATFMEYKIAREEERNVCPSPLHVRAFGLKHERMKVSSRDFFREAKVAPQDVVRSAISHHDKVAYDLWMEKSNVHGLALDGSTFFHEAAKWNCAEFIRPHYQALNGSMPDINARLHTSRRTALHIAARRGFDEVVDAIFALTAKIEVDAKISHGDKKHPGWTALHLAAKYGHINIVKKIIARSPKSLSVLTCDNEDALAIARKFGHHRTSKVIAEEMLDIAMREGNQAKVISLIQSGFVELNPLSDRMPILHRAASLGLVNVVKNLLAMSTVFPNAKISDRHSAYHGYTPLHLAVNGGHLEVAELIVAKCPESAKTLSPAGKSVLEVARRKCDMQMFQFFQQRLQTSGFNPRSHVSTIVRHHFLAESKSRAPKQSYQDKRAAVNLVSLKI